MNAKEEIRKYIDQEEFCGALLLTGKWGSGKTYLLKEIAKEISEKSKLLSSELNSDTKEKTVLVFVSLFGVDTVETLDKRIKQNILTALFGMDADKGKTLKSLGHIADGIKSAFSEKTPSFLKGILNINLVELFDTIYPTLQKGKKLVLVFDDFERSSIPVDVRIGAINEYVECHGIRTIIIADEEKISDEKYSEFKEKVISRTVHLCPDYRQIIGQIILSHKTSEKGYVDFLKSIETDFQAIVAISRTDNLRTAKSIVIDFERVYSLWNKYGYGIDSPILKNVFFSFAAASFEVKKGNTNLEKIDELYPFFSAPGANLRSLLLWIKTGDWNEDMLAFEIVRDLFPPEQSDEYKFLHYSIYDLEESTISSAVSLLLQTAYYGDCPANELMLLLERIYLLKASGLKCMDEYSSQKLLNGWKKREEKIKSGEISEERVAGFISNTSKLDKNEKILYRKIDSLENLLPYWVSRRQILAEIKSDTLDYSNYRGIIIYNFDNEFADTVKMYYVSTSNKTKRAILRIINDIHIAEIISDEEIEETIANLESLVSILQSALILCDDAITRMITQHGISSIEEKLNEYKEYREAYRKE